MDKKEKTEAERVEVNCTFMDTAGIGTFFMADKEDAARRLIKELDERRVVDQWGKLIFKFVSGTKISNVEMDVGFRKIGCTRTFITLYNNEAVNMLMNKLKRKRIPNQPGALIFEFIPVKRDIDRQIYTCGHSRFAHVYMRHRRKKDDYGRCDVEDCKCRQYVPKENKEAPK